VRLTLPSGAESASETNLMEKTAQDLKVESNSVSVHTKPYEIKTISVRFASKH